MLDIIPYNKCTMLCLYLINLNKLNGLWLVCQYLNVHLKKFKFEKTNYNESRLM